MDILYNMEACWHMSLRVQISNKRSESPPPHRFPYPGEPSGRILPTGGNVQYDHIIPHNLEPTFCEGGLKKDERLLPRRLWIISNARLDQYQVDHSGVGRTVPEIICPPRWENLSGGGGLILESFQIQMGFTFPFLRANDLRLSLLNIRAHSF